MVKNIFNNIGHWFSTSAKKFAKHMRQIWTVFRGEFVSQFTAAKMAGVLFTVLLPLIPVLVSGKITGSPERSVEQETWGQLGRLFATGVMYAMIFRFVSVLKDASTLDKNRISYLTHPKGKVLFAKIFADGLQFLLTITITIVIGTAIVVIKNEGALNAEFYERTAVYIAATLSVYLLATIGMRFIQYVVKRKDFRILGLATWIALTLITYVVLSITTGVVTEDKVILNPDGTKNIIPTWPMMEFATDNKMWISFVPFLNLINIPVMVYGTADLWTVTPIIAYTMIGSIIVWRKLSSAAKEFLCA